MPATDWGWLITPEELESWILLNHEDLLVVNKPPFVLCHPSKHGPWSSLIGACREYLGLERLHMPSRLDRETSGVVCFAKTQLRASQLQTAIQQRRVHKTYTAILTGALAASVTVDEPIGRDPASSISVRQWRLPESEGGYPAQTTFHPLHSANGFTLARVLPTTGRLHQIRVHAAWLGNAIAGDKLYGPDPGLFLEFIDHGFTAHLAEKLPLNRHALHASRLEFCLETETISLQAPLSPDLREFAASRIGVPEALLAAL